MTDVDIATEPVAAAPESAPAPEVTPEAPDVPETPEVEGETTPEGEGGLPDQPEVQPDPLEALPEPDRDTVEVELNGLKYRVPAALKDGYMQHADYTLKTQEVADKGRALDSAREALNQQAQNHRQHIQDFGELAHTDKLLEDFRQVDFQQLQQEDPDQANALNFRFQQLRDTRQQIVERIQKREYDARVTAERTNANRKNQLTATLAREIPNYTPEVHSQMDQIATSVGFSPEEISAFADPRHYKVLQLAMIGAEVLKRKRAATTQPAPTPVKPVPQVKGGRTPDTGPTDRQGVDAWMRSRNQQVRKRETG